MLVKLVEENFVFSLPFHLNHLAKSCGARFHPSTKTWRAKGNKVAAAAILRNFKPDQIDPAIADMAGESVQIPELIIDPNSVLKNPLRKRQMEGLLKAWKTPAYALFWSMGAGKTITTVALINLRRQYGMIDRVLIICPTSVKSVWTKEFKEHSALPMNIQILEAGDKVGDPEMLVVGVEALSQGNAFDKALEFVNRGKCMVVVDESSRIKNYKAGRTERCWEIGEAAIYRLILTGTSITQGLQDLYAQMYFLDPAIIGELSFYSFRNKYMIMGGFENRKIIGYVNTEHLLSLIKPYCDVVKKSDIEGLPEFSFQVRNVKATPVQIRTCKELQKEMTTQFGDKVVSVQNALEALLRFQQIAGGFDPDGVPVGDKNPKMEELIEILRDFDGKAIIWARYIPEINAIFDALIYEFGASSAIKFTGNIPSDERGSLVSLFQENPHVRFFVANQQTGGLGLTLTAATLAIYYSNTFSHEERAQSLDRCHRIGQKNPVLYIDLVSDLKVDQLVMQALANKKSMAEYVSDGLSVKDMV